MIDLPAPTPSLFILFHPLYPDSLAPQNIDEPGPLHPHPRAHHADCILGFLRTVQSAVQKGFGVGEVRRSVLSHKELGAGIDNAESGALGVPGRVDRDVAGEEDYFVREKSELVNRRREVGGEGEEG